MTTKPEDFGALTESDKPNVNKDPVTERDLLGLAKNSLLFIGWIFILAILYRMLGHFLGVSQEVLKEVFSNITQILTPIATLIIGYYFSVKSSR